MEHRCEECGLIHFVRGRCPSDAEQKLRREEEDLGLAMNYEAVKKRRWRARNHARYNAYQRDLMQKRRQL